MQLQRVLLSKSRIDTRTQTEGPSPYWYSLNSTKSQANTTSSCSGKATNTESTCSSATDVTNLQGPPSERTPEDKIWDLKSLAQQYARDLGSCDDTRISYLEFVESEAEADLTLARMIAG
jgi:hypothetical protein